MFFSFFCGNTFAQEDPYNLEWLKNEPQDNAKGATQDQKDQKEETEEVEELYAENDRGLVNTGVVFFPLYSNGNGESAFGLDFMYYFRRHNESPLSSPNYIRTFFTIGRHEYANVGASFNNYWNNEENNLYLSLFYGKRLAGFFEPFKYQPAFLGQYRASDFDFNLMFRTKVTSFSYLGVKYELVYNMMDRKIPPSAFTRNDLIGLNGGPNSGIGIVWNNAPVENVFSPKGGYVFDVTNMFYSKYFGGDFNFGKHLFDIKEYYKVYGEHTLVFQVYALLHSGNVPYTQLARVGDIFNAYSVDKYTGRHMMAVKGEYRLPIFERTFLTGFIGLAYITNVFAKFRLNDNLPSYGGGIRFLLDAELNINARLDVVSGRDGTGVWIGIGEGF